MTLWNIARACQGRLVVPTGNRPVCQGSGIRVIRRYSGKEAAGIVLDSRQVEPGFVFVAARGERVCSVRQALFAPHRTVTAAASLGRVCGAPTVACPPAIPIAVSGEAIGPAAVELFRLYGVEQVAVLTE